MLKLAIVALVALGALAACGPSDREPSAPKYRAAAFAR